MTQRDRPRQRLVAVSLALIMLVSIGGLAFVGAASADTTGGTFDGTIDDQVAVNDTLNIDDNDGDTLLVGESGEIGPDGDEVSLQDDGAVDIDPTGSAGEFAGVGLTLDRVDAAGSFDADPSDQTTFLEEIENVHLDSEDGDAFEAVFIEFDPQSDFSQIEGADLDEGPTEEGDVEGTHDFIVVGPAGDLDDDVYVNEDLTGGDYSADDLVAVSVDNDAVSDGIDGGESSIIADSTDSPSFGEIFGDLVGDDESDLQNKNIDNAIVAGGVVGSGDDVVDQLYVENGDAPEDGETHHSEKIALVDSDDGDERHFSTIDSAIEEATENDDIVLDRGEYDSANYPEEADITELNVEGLTLKADEDRTTASDSFDERLTAVAAVDNDGTEATIDAALTNAETDSSEFDGAVDDVTIDGVHVTDAEDFDDSNYDRDGEHAVALFGDDGAEAELSNAIIASPSSLSGGTPAAVALATDADGELAGTVSSNAFLEGNSVESFDETGLNVDPDENVDTFDVDLSSNLFAGFETLIDGDSDLDLNQLDDLDTEFDDDRAQAVILENDAGDIVSENLYGSLDTADDDADIGDADVIDVFSGTYDENPTIDSANDVEITGDAAAVVGSTGTVEVNAGDFTLEDFTIAANTNLESAGSDDVTFEDIRLAGGDGQIMVTDADDDVTITDVDVTDDYSTVSSNTPVISVATDGQADDIEVSSSEIDLDNDAIGVELDAVEADTIEVDDVTIDGLDTGVSTDGAIDATIDEADDEEADITNNHVENGGDGTGIYVDFAADEEGLVIDDNTVLSDGDFDGIEIVNADDLATDTSSISGNVIVGGSVASGTGLDLGDVPTSGIDEIIDEDDTNNAITGFEELIVDSGGDLSSTTTERVRDASDLGTYAEVTDEDGDIDSNGLFGNVDRALEDAATDEEATITVTETDVDAEAGVNLADIGPENYDHGEASIDFEDGESVTLEGIGTEDDDPIVIIEQTSTDPAIEIGPSGDDLNNHNIEDLRLEVVDNDDQAIIVSQDNAQTIIDDIELNASSGSATGIDVEADNSDVNVVTVTNSHIMVDETATGVDLASGVDDRDGFDINNNVIESDQLTDSGVGIDVADVDKPGKQDPALGVDFNIADNDLSGFATQVNVEDGTFDDDQQVFEDILENNDNTFEEQIIFLNESNFDYSDNDDLYGNIYGDVETAVDDLNEVNDGEVDSIIADVSTATYDYADTVEIGASDAGNADNVTVRGNDATISGDVLINDAGEDTQFFIEDLTFLADNDAVGDVSDLDDSVIIDVDLDDDDGVDTIFLDSADSEFDVSTVTIDGDNTGENGLDIENTVITHDVAFDDNDDIETIINEGESNNVGASSSETSLENVSAATDSITANVTGVTVAEDFDNSGSDGETVTFNGADISDADDTWQAPNKGGVVVLGGEDDDSTLTIEESNIDVEGDGLNITETAAADEINVEDTDITADEDVNSIIQSEFAANERVGTGSAVNTDSVDSSNLEITLEGGEYHSVSENENDDAVNITQVEDGVESYSIDGVDVTSNGGVGINITATDGSDVDVVGGTAVEAAGNATDIRNSDSAADVTLQRSSFESDATALYIADQDGAAFQSTNEEIEGNAFVGADHDIVIEDQNDFDAGEIDVTLNFIGSEKGPAASDAAGILVTDSDADAPIYDPFLTTGPDEIDPADDPQTTTEFGHDVIIESDSFTAIGFPAEPSDDELGDRTLDQYFDEEFEGAIYGFENPEDEDPQFSTQIVDFENTDVDAFDGFVVENAGDEDHPVLIDYNDRDPADVADNRYTFNEGLNFLSPAQAGTVDETLIPGGDTDVVAQPFELGGNLYGDQGADQVRDSFVDPDAAGFGDNFRSGAGDRVVHPHAAYLVIVNEEDNEGLQTIESIPTPDTPTADQIADRTDASAVTGTSNFQITNVDAGALTAGGDNDDVDVDLQNIGDEDGEQDVTLRLDGELTDIDGNQGDAFNLPDTQEAVSLDSGETDTLEFTDYVDDDGELEDGDTVALVVETDDDEETVIITVE